MYRGTWVAPIVLLFVNVVFTTIPVLCQIIIVRAIFLSKKNTPKSNDKSVLGINYRYSKQFYENMVTEEPEGEYDIMMEHLEDSYQS